MQLQQSRLDLESAECQDSTKNAGVVERAIQDTRPEPGSWGGEGKPCRAVPRPRIPRI
jgi:hypothetical protein